MRQRSLLFRSGLAVCLLGLGAVVYAPPAQATTLTAGSISGSLGETETWKIGSSTESGFAGAIPGTFASNSFNMYCVDLAHSFGVPSSWTAVAKLKAVPLNGYSDTQAQPGGNYGQDGTAPNLLVHNAGEIAYLVNKYGDGGVFSIVGNPGAEGALQLAIWQLEYGASFTPLSNIAATAAYVAEATLNGGATSDAIFYDPKSNTEYGQVPQAFVSPGPEHAVTPEPTTLVLWGSVMIGLAGIRRIKRGSVL